MTNEEAKMFLDNLKVCIDEHPVVADWLVEIADRKTEPQTEETEMERLERIDNELEDAWARIRELTDEPQTDCSWK